MPAPARGRAGREGAGGNSLVPAGCSSGISGRLCRACDGTTGSSYLMQ